MPQKTRASLFLSDRSRNRPPLLLLEAIPHAAFGQDYVRVRGVGFELLPEVPDVHVDRALVTVLRVAEYVLQQLGTREDATGLACKREEDLELEERELDRVAVPVDRALDRVDPQSVVYERLIRGLLAPAHAGAPEDGLDAAAQLAHGARLDDVVVGAELQAQHTVGDFLRLRREHDDRHRALRTNAPADLEAVELRQHHVEHHQIERLLVELVEGLLAVKCGHDVVALAPERAVK